MNRPRSTTTQRILLGSALLLVPLAGASCSKESAPKPEKVAATAAPAAPKLVVPIAFQPKGNQATEIANLAKKLDKKNWRFSNRETNKPANAKLFTYLAASSEDPVLVGAALQAMYSAYSSHSKKRATPDADFVAVVKKYLHSDNPRLVARALLAARTASSGKKGNKELIGEVVKVAKKQVDGPGRYAVIDALRVVSATNRKPEVMEVFRSSLDSKHAYVVSYALQALYRSTRSIKERDKLKAKTFELARHEDPGVRGRAVELLGSLGKGDDEAIALTLGALKDPSGYVRSEACDSLARLRHQPAIHDLIALVDDKARNRYDLKGWTTLDNRPGRLHHDGSAWSYVYDSAMNAIRSLSKSELKLERVNPKEITKGLATNAELTKSWYKGARAKIAKNTIVAKEIELPASALEAATEKVSPTSGAAPKGQKAAAPGGAAKPAPAKPAAGH